jgi:dihydrodipicolinate synthase/N-acetylneuraminate lyase
MEQPEAAGAPGRSAPWPLRGVLPVFQTPFREDEEIDPGALEAEIDWLFRNGADGVVMGMVSEVARLSSEERDTLCTLVCRLAGSRGPVITSVGAESSHQAVRHARHAEASGAAAVMAIAPVTVAIDVSQLRRYFERLVTAVAIPVVVQDAGGYVGTPLPIEAQAQLYADFGDRVAFKPEAPPAGPRVTRLLELTGGRAAIFEGRAGLSLIESYQRGVVGTMPGADVCWAVRALWAALSPGDLDRAYEIHARLVALASIPASIDAFVAVEKYLLVKQGVIGSAARREPVGFVLDAEMMQQVDRLLGRLLEVVGT